MFSKWKEIKRIFNPKNKNDLISTIENVFDLVTSSYCEGYFKIWHPIYQDAIIIKKIYN